MVAGGKKKKEEKTKRKESFAVAFFALSGRYKGVRVR